MPITALAIGAGVGLLKSEAIDRPKESRQRQLAAETQRYSPWTNLKADPIQEADPLGSALTYGGQGAMLGAGMQNAKAQQGLMQAQTRWLDAGGSPSYTAQIATTGSPYGGLSSIGPSGPRQPFWYNDAVGSYKF